MCQQKSYKYYYNIFSPNSQNILNRWTAIWNDDKQFPSIGPHCSRKRLVNFWSWHLLIYSELFSFYMWSTPRILLASWMSRGKRVTRLAWMAHRLASENNMTRNASAAYEEEKQTVGSTGEFFLNFIHPPIKHRVGECWGVSLSQLAWSECRIHHTQGTSSSQDWYGEKHPQTLIFTPAI